MIRIIAEGKIKEKWIRDGIDEYLKRMRNIEIVEVKVIGTQKLPDDVFIMSEEGMLCDSVEFSKILKDDSCFVIGGPDGLSDEYKQNGKVISLSRMTFTHEMARLFLIEQIYRAKTIKENKKYHRA